MSSIDLLMFTAGVTLLSITVPGLIFLLLCMWFGYWLITEA